MRQVTFQMNTVNLVPDDIKLTQIRQRRLRYWCVITLVTVLLTAGWVTIKYLNYHKMVQSAHLLSQQANKVQQEINDLEKTRQKLDRWQDQFMLMDALGKYPDYIAITGFLAQHCPAFVYLDEMEIILPDKLANNNSNSSIPNRIPGAKMFVLKQNVASKGKKSTAKSLSAKGKSDQIAQTNEYYVLHIKGHAVRNDDVAVLLSSLQKSKLFCNVQLKSTKRQERNKIVTIVFDIECEVPVCIAIMQ